MKLFKRKVIMYEIKEIPFKICEHDPKAQSVFTPKRKINYNEFQINIKQQLKKLYDLKRSTPDQERI